MRRGEQTTAGELKIGDRFYKAGLRIKKVYQLVDDKPNSLKICSVDVMDSKMHYSAKITYFERVLVYQEVIFLRNVNETN